jgi:thiol:disulfide interchange protein DsbC
MKKKIISLTLGLLLSGNAFANDNIEELTKAKDKAIQEINLAKDKAIKEINVNQKVEKKIEVQSPALNETLSAEDFELKLTSSGKFKNYGGIEVVRSIFDLGLGNLYEIKLGGKDNGVMTADGKYVFLGDIINFDNGTHTNISADYRLSLMASTAEDEINSLSEDVFVTYKPTVDKIGTLYVYTDTTCGYCVKLHNEIEQLTSAGVEVKYIPYPRSSAAEEVPVSRNEAGELVYGENKTLIQLGSIYCQEDKATALTHVKSGGTTENYLPAYEANKEACNDIVKKGYDSGQNIGFDGTPFLYLDNGKVVPGYQPASSIINMFKTGK